MPADKSEKTLQDAKTAGEAAAAWWVAVLRDPKLDNGDANPLVSTLITMSKETMPQQPTDGLERFAAILAERLNQQLDSGGEWLARYGATLDVDYHPNALLAECAEQAGLYGGITDWPWKTNMRVKPNEVSVSYGYRAETQVVWTKSS